MLGKAADNASELALLGILKAFDRLVSNGAINTKTKKKAIRGLVANFDR